MTPAELRQAAATLSGEARGRLLERADVVEDLLARMETQTYGGQVRAWLATLAMGYSKGWHV
jgi:hypothetical protein